MPLPPPANHSWLTPHIPLTHCLPLLFYSQSSPAFPFPCPWLFLPAMPAASSTWEEEGTIPPSIISIPPSPDPLSIQFHSVYLRWHKNNMGRQWQHDNVMKKAYAFSKNMQQAVQAAMPATCRCDGLIHPSSSSVRSCPYPHLPSHYTHTCMYMYTL